jgi:hypothetical protein
MAIKDIFTGKSSSKSSGDQDMPVSPPGTQQGRIGGLSRLLSKEKPARVDLGEREKTEFEQESDAIISRIEKHRATEHGIGRILKHPVRVITEKPLKSLYVTIPVALAFFILGTAYVIRDYGVSALFISTAASANLTDWSPIASTKLAAKR